MIDIPRRKPLLGYGHLTEPANDRSVYFANGRLFRQKSGLGHRGLIEDSSEPEAEEEKRRKVQPKSATPAMNNTLVNLEI